MEGQLANLEVRLTRAERQLRTSRWAAAVLVIVTLTLLIAKPGVTLVEDSKVVAPFRVVDSRGDELLRVDSDELGARLFVMNRKGRPALLLRETGVAVYGNDGMVTGGLYNAQDGGALILAGKNGKQVAGLFALDTGGSLSIHDNSATPVAGMRATGNGGGMILSNKDGKRAVQLIGTENGGSVAVFDAREVGMGGIDAGPEGGTVTVARRTGKTAAQLAATGRGGHLSISGDNGELSGEPGLIRFYDGKGVPRISITQDPDGGPSVYLSDRTGFGRAIVGLSSEGEPAINLHGPQGSGHVLAHVSDDDGPRLALTDKNGKSVLKAPQ